MSEAGRSDEDARARIEQELRRFFAERSRGAISADEIDPTLHLFDAGYVDSMNSLTLLDFIEKRYGIAVPEVDLVGGLSTLGALCDYVASRESAGR